MWVYYKRVSRSGKWHIALGLLISSAHSAYLTQSGEVQQLAAHLIQIDRILGEFGQDGAQARHLLRKLVASDIDRTWRDDGTGSPSAPFQAPAEGLQLFSQIAREMRRAG